jgi:quercetin dioxygenase-like cupin family protein
VGALRGARRRRDRAAALLVLAACAAPAAHAGQDLVAVAPELAQVEHEDARVRVVRLRIPEHATLATHDRPRRVVVSLSANHVRLTGPDGASRETRTAAGTAAWSEPAVRSVANLGAALENVVIELPQAAVAAQPVDAPPALPPADYLAEPRHRWLFENQYVRVYDVRIPPGETTEFHRHAYDQVAVLVSGGRVASQVEGRPWQPAATIAPRGVEISSDAGQPFTHRVRNDGTAEFHVILVQLLR